MSTTLKLLLAAFQVKSCGLEYKLHCDQMWQNITSFWSKKVAQILPKVA